MYRTTRQALLLFWRRQKLQAEYFNEVTFFARSLSRNLRYLVRYWGKAFNRTIRNDKFLSFYYLSDLTMPNWMLYCVSLTSPSSSWPRTPPFHGGNRGSNPLGDALFFYFPKPIIDIRKTAFLEGKSSPAKSNIPQFPAITYNLECPRLACKKFSLSPSAIWRSEERWE